MGSSEICRGLPPHVSKAPKDQDVSSVLIPLALESVSGVEAEALQSAGCTKSSQGLPGWAGQEEGSSLQICPQMPGDGWANVSHLHRAPLRFGGVPGPLCPAEWMVTLRGGAMPDECGGAM